MSRFTYTPEMLAFLKDGYKNHGVPELAELFNKEFGTSKTASEIKGALSNHKIRCGRTTGEINKGKIKAFTTEQIAFIKEAYQQMTIVELTKVFNQKFNENKSAELIKGFTSRQGITCGRSGLFKKDHTPHNKGVKGWMPGGKAQKSQFKKGQIAINHKPVGSERICSKDGYVLIKTAEPRTWRMKHVVEWEKHHGPIPKGHRLWFKDNDRTNWHIDNLMLITRAQGVVINKQGMGTVPAELKTAAVTLADISMKRRALTNPGAAA